MTDTPIYCGSRYIDCTTMEEYIVLGLSSHLYAEEDGHLVILQLASGQEPSTSLSWFVGKATFRRNFTLVE